MKGGNGQDKGLAVKFEIETSGQLSIHYAPAHEDQVRAALEQAGLQVGRSEVAVWMFWTSRVSLFENGEEVMNLDDWGRGGCGGQRAERERRSAEGRGGGWC